MNSSRLEKDKKVKDTRSLFRLKKETDDNTIKDTRNLFRLNKKGSNQIQNHRRKRLLPTSESR